METRHFEYYRKDNYGNVAYYPADDESREAMRFLRPNQKTIMPNDFKALEFFGYAFVEVFSPAKEADIKQRVG